MAIQLFRQNLTKINEAKGNKNKKQKHKLLQRGRKRERERVKKMCGAYKKGLILTIRWVPSW